MRLLRPAAGLAVVFFCATAFGATALEKEREASRTARGPLPDPDLLDGAGQKSEKRADHGMLGEFEIPGEDTKSDKVGGQQPDKAGGSGPQMEAQKDQSGGGGGSQQDKSAQSGGGGQQQDKSAQSGGGGQQGGDQNSKGGGGGQQSADASAPGGGGEQGAAGQNGSPGGGPQSGDPGSKAGGMQVAQVSSGSAGQQGGQGTPGGGKPTQISIGDPSMQIKQPAAAQGAVGAQVAGSTQQMEKAIGSGTGATGGSSGGRGGAGVEKGQTMPKGL